MIDKHSIEMRYTQSLDLFFRGEQEKALYEVTDIGKELLMARMGPDVILEIHSTALKEMAKNSDPLAISKMVVDANEVLTNSLMGYAMYYYSFMEMLDVETKKREGTQAELNVTNTELEIANKRLLELDRLKSMFIASTSHELRTPLNSIIGFTSVLLEGWSGDLNPEQKEQLGIVLTSGKYLLSLINDVIDISKIEAGKIEVFIEQFRLGEVMDEAVSIIKTDLEEKGLTMTVDVTDVTIAADRRRLLQCMINLLSNAVKFSEKGSVTLKAKTINNVVDISISDTGIGIKEEDLPKLFNAFVRLETHLTDKTTGTGLGLYLTDKLVTEVLGGTVDATSKHGVGSTFTLHIPIKLGV